MPVTKRFRRHLASATLFLLSILAPVAHATEAPLSQRIDAAKTTAGSNPACQRIRPFYWEIGDVHGKQASGTESGSGLFGDKPTATTEMEIASASKWIFGAYVLEKLDVTPTHPLPADVVPYLNFTSGYDNLSSLHCLFRSSVDSCFRNRNGNGGHNNDRNDADIGHFFYNGGHMQALAIKMGLGKDERNGWGRKPLLADEIMRYLGSDIHLKFKNVLLSGGIEMNAENYARFLRKILDGELRMHNYLGTHAVCTNPHDPACPTAIYSPVDQSKPQGPDDISTESWHYSLGHWVEDDPIHGDGAFSSPGAFGFYPWIDASKTWYGLIARHDLAHAGHRKSGEPSGVSSVYCGRLIRQAWLTGQIP